MTTLSMAAAGLYHRKTRTIVTQISLCLATALVTVTLSGVHYIDRMVGGWDNPRVYVMSPSASSVLPFAYVEALRKLPGVGAPLAWHRSYGGAKITPEQPHRFGVWGVSDEFPRFYSPHIFVLSDEAHRSWLADRQGILVGADMAATLGWKTGQNVIVPTPFADLPGRVTVLPGHSDAVMFHYDNIDQLPGSKSSGTVTRIMVPATGDMLALIRTIDANFEHATEPTMSVPEASFHERFLSSISVVPQLLAKVGWLVAFVIVLITASTLMTSVRERRGALATLRALGFTRGRIFTLIVFESVLLATPAALIGCALPYVFFRGGVNMGPMMDHIPILAAGAGLAFVGAIVVGIVCALLPAINAARTNVIAGLQR